MNDKSHVSLEQHVCLVCGTAFDTGAILLDKRLRASMERHTATGWGLCPEHQKLADDGFVALIECDPQRSVAGWRAHEARHTGRAGWPICGARCSRRCSTCRSRTSRLACSLSLA